MKKKFIAFFLVFALMVTTYVPSVAFAKPQEDSERGTTAFSDIKYVRPNVKAIRKKIASIVPLLEKKGNLDKITSIFESIDDNLNDFNTMETYIYIAFQTDVTDMDIASEYYYLSEKYNNLLAALSDVYIKAFDSQYGEAIKKEMSQEDIDAIYDLNKTLTPEYIALSTRTLELVSNYHNVMYGTTIDVKGVEMTEEQIAASTTLTADEMTEYSTQLYIKKNQLAGEIYLELVDAYNQLAKYEGFDNYADDAYDSYGRDYTKKDAMQFANYVKQTIVPVYLDLLSSFTQEDFAKLASIEADISNMDDQFSKYFSSISDNMSGAYDYMKKLDLCNLEASPLKAETSYTLLISSLNESYISIYRYGDVLDETTFIHEFGHYTADYIHGTSLDFEPDICEIHSQGNEVLYLPNYEKYGDASETIRKYVLLSMLDSIVQGCVYEEFQQYAYNHDVTDVVELNKAFFNIKCSYGLQDPNSGYTQDLSWIQVPHNYECPFYYLSYAISAVTALEIFTKSLSDYDGAVKTYNRLVNCGTDYDMANMIVRCRLHSQFSYDNLNNIATTIYNLYHPEVNTAVDPAA